MLLPCTITKVLLLANTPGSQPGEGAGQNAGCKLGVNSKFYPPPRFEPQEAIPSCSRAKIKVLGLNCQDGEECYSNLV